MVRTRASEIVDLMMPLIMLEREAETIDTQEDYEAFRTRHQAQNSRVLGRLREAGFIREDATLADMGEIFEMAMRDLAERGNAMDRAVGRAVLNEAWTGLRGWTA